MGFGTRDRLRDQPQHRRVQTVRFRRQGRVLPVDRQGVLRQVIGANGEEIAMCRQIFRLDGRCRHFHHDADRDDRCIKSRTNPLADFPQADDLTYGCDHWEHDGDLPALRRGAINRP